MGRMISMNLRVSDYASRVLGVIKEKYGLRDKSQALERFAEMFGEEFADQEIKEEVAREVIDSCERHIKKHGFRKMSLDELDKLCRGE